jgi:hypothetical protein
MSDCNNSTEYEDDLFFSTTHGHDNDFFSDTFTASLDDSRNGFFERFQAEISTSAM